MAMLFGLSLLIAATVHVAWFLRQRSSRFPAIGTKWAYATYMKKYVSEVMEHHPLTNEITVIRVEEGNPLSAKTRLRVNSEKFMATVSPYKEKRSR